MQNNHYSIKVINRDGVSCISVIDSGKHYGITNKKEPEGIIYKGFKDKPKVYGKILIKLGLWKKPILKK